MLQRAWRRLLLAAILLTIGVTAALAQAEKVYVTRTGSKYHRASCTSLRSSAIEMLLAEAAAHYDACRICRPPVPGVASHAAPVEQRPSPASAAPSRTSIRERFAGRIVGVTDGDTIAVMRDGRSARVRLEGIDCPERGQDFGARAKQFTSRMAFGKDAVVEVRDVDRYGRLVARVNVGGEDVSLALVRSGLAWHYTKYSRDPELAEAEMAAKSSQLGLWSRPAPTPPWEFRQSAPLGRNPVQSR